MASVTFLGTGSGRGVPGRFQSSLLLETGEANILLDAGEPCAAQLLNRGFALPDLDAVWITHAHSDHTGGLPMLLQASWLHGRERPLPLGLPAHLIEPLSHWLRASLLPPETLSFPLEVFPWEVGVRRDHGSLAITPYLTSHLDRTREKMGEPSIEAFLFDISFAGKRIVYTGDIGSMADLTPHLIAPIDVLVCELAHVSPEDALAALAPFMIDTVCFTHLSGEAASRQGEIMMLCSEALPLADTIYFPEDGERIEI